MVARRCGLIVALVMSCGALWAQEKPLFIGTWKLNLAKSKFSSGPPPKSQIHIFEPYGNNGLTVTLEVINEQGNKATRKWSANFDGKLYPFVARQTVMLKRIDDYTVERTTYLAEKELSHVRFVVSKDGKTMTNTLTSTNAQGQAVNSLLVYDKQ